MDPSLPSLVPSSRNFPFNTDFSTLKRLYVGFAAPHLETNMSSCETLSYRSELLLPVEY